MNFREKSVLIKCRILMRYGSQVKCARALGIDELRLSRIIHGRAKATSQEKQVLVQALNLPDSHFDGGLQG